MSIQIQIWLIQCGLQIVQTKMFMHSAIRYNRMHPSTNLYSTWTPELDTCLSAMCYSYHYQ